MDATDWDAVKAEVDALRQRMSGMGAVNLVAIEEYSELKGRHDFLRSQSDDLTKAKADLIAAIDEINQTSQKQFELTFEQIKKNFEYTFQTLLAGDAPISSSCSPRTYWRAGSRSSPSPGHEAEGHFPALRRTAHADGGRAPIRSLPGQAFAVLPAR